MKLSSFFHLACFSIKTILLRQKNPILGTIILTDKCNLSCKHCSVNNITAVLHPYRQIRAEMEKLYGMGIRILFFAEVRPSYGMMVIKRSVIWSERPGRWVSSL